ncbi:MAG: MTH1187 family thiamine-binding protein [Bacillus sp. (in: Bacteria)]|nr:MTH1187 family thiamine-binding protein [Bacillus sp. (in: firmicutes)]
MAIADITIIPIGTNSTSVSDVVAEIHLILKQTNKPITYELTPMSTLIEGELPVLLEVIKEIHEVPFKLGHQRVATNIRIDDRRDKPSSMSGKLQAVQGKLNTKDIEDNGIKELKGLDK